MPSCSQHSTFVLSSVYLNGRLHPPYPVACSGAPRGMPFRGWLLLFLWRNRLDRGGFSGLCHNIFVCLLRIHSAGVYVCCLWVRLCMLIRMYMLIFICVSVCYTMQLFLQGHSSKITQNLVASTTSKPIRNSSLLVSLRKQKPPRI